MDENISSKLEGIENQLSNLNQSVKDIDYKFNQTNEKILSTKKEVEKAKKAAYSADSNTSIWFIGFLIIGILALISNPTVSGHQAFLKENGLDLDILDVNKYYKSYWVFSKVDVNGDKDEGTITFGIFGHVYKGSELKEKKSD